nr:hypothetical protein [Tanacetum cinerariifolium]
HDRLQKLVSQLDIHGVSLSQEDVNLKFLRILPSEWKTHTLIWKNKADLEEQSLDDLFSSFDMSKVECYNYHRKGHFAREYRSPKDSRRNGSYDWSYQAEEEPANYALMAFSSSSSSSDTETKEKHGLGYFSSESDYESCSPSSLSDRPTAPIIEDWVSDYEDESETIAPQVVPSFVQSSEQVKTPRHSVQPVESSILAATPKPTSPKSNSSGKRRNRKTCFVCKSVDHLIKDCDYHTKKMAQPTPRNYAHRVLTQFKPVSITDVRQVSATMPKIMVTRPRLAH